MKEVTIVVTVSDHADLHSETEITQTISDLLTFPGRRRNLTGR